MTLRLKDPLSGKLRWSPRKIHEDGLKLGDLAMSLNGFHFKRMAFFFYFKKYFCFCFVFFY